MSPQSTYERHADSPFVRWTNLLGGHFFNEAQEGRTVWLTATPALLDQVGAAIGSGTAGLVDVLMAGPPWDPQRGELCRNARAAHDAWRSKHRPPPPYPLHLAYLCLFAAAGATGDGATRVNAYYPRLRTLTGLPGSGTPRHFQHMTSLWEDLERWSSQDARGSLGIFRAAGVGQQRHIGLPLAQNLITPAERQALPAAFGAAALWAVPPTPEAASAAVTASASRHLTRLRGLLTGPGQAAADRNLLQALLAEALALWQEQVPPARAPAPAPARPPLPAAAPVVRRGRLALAARLDRIAGHISCYLRLHLDDFPDVPVQFAWPAGHLSCDEQAHGWSSPLAANGQVLDAARLAWDRATELTAAELNFRSELPAGQVRVLQPASAAGLPHLLEAAEIQPGQPAVVLASEPAWSAAVAWCRADPSAREVSASGLPAGWRLLAVDRCPPPEGVAGLLPWAPATDGLRIHFDGGLRPTDGSRHSYLDHARPLVRLSGGTGAESLTASGHRLPSIGMGRFELPAALSAGTHHLEVRSGGAPLASAQLTLVAPAPSRASAAARAAGPVRWHGRRDVLLAPGLWQHHEEAGRRPQQLILLTRDGQALPHTSTLLAPSDAAVWAIPEGRHPTAAYVGCGQPDTEVPLLDQPSPAWIEFLAGRNPTAGRIAPPAEPRLADLWRAYEEAARGHG